MPASEAEKLLERTIAAMEQQKQAVKIYFVNEEFLNNLDI